MIKPNKLIFFLNLLLFLVICVTGCEKEDKDNNPADSGEYGFLEYPVYGTSFGTYITIKDIDTDLPVANVRLTITDENGTNYSEVTNNKGELRFGLPRANLSMNIKIIQWSITRANATSYHGFSGQSFFLAGRVKKVSETSDWEYPEHETFYMEHL